MNKVYKLENIYKFYNKTYALSNINLEINEGELVVILGPSGSGKSTLLNLIGGIDKSSKGKIYFNNSRVDNLNTIKLNNYRKNNIGFVFQSYNLLSNLNVYENIELGANISKNHLNITKIMDKLNLTKLKNKYPYQLSGGEMQRTAIARAIVKNPSVLLCDEPTGALDETNGKEVLKVLKFLNEEYKTTVIIVTHNPAIALISDKIIKMNSGKIVEIIKNEDKKPISELGWS